MPARRLQHDAAPANSDADRVLAKRKSGSQALTPPRATEGQSARLPVRCKSIRNRLLWAGYRSADELIESRDRWIGDRLMLSPTFSANRTCIPGPASESEMPWYLFRNVHGGITDRVQARWRVTPAGRA